MARPPKRRKSPAEAAVDLEIDRLFNEHGRNIQFNMMDLGKIFQAGQAAAAAGTSIEEAVIAAIEQYRIAGGQPAGCKTPGCENQAEGDSMYCPSCFEAKNEADMAGEEVAVEQWRGKGAGVQRGPDTPEGAADDRPCPKCGGLGWITWPGAARGSGPVTCPRCEGRKTASLRLGARQAGGSDIPEGSADDVGPTGPLCGTHGWQNDRAWHHDFRLNRKVWTPPRENPVKQGSDDLPPDNPGESKHWAFEPGSISHGTLNSEDLIDAFMSALADVVDNTGDPEAEKLLIEVEERMQAGDEYYETEEAQWDLDSISDVLEMHAPPGCYFGAHVGDGSDFGFWPNEDEDEDDGGEFGGGGSHDPDREDFHSDG